ncbi:MAG: hypothetical protein PF693_18255 [Spirochaetia bacterium]|nr:hypothetical protein [Spirochaetia bacterium]
MNKLTGIIFLLIINIFTISASENIIDFLSTEEKELLLTDGEISRYFFDKELPSYLFDNSFENKLLDEISKQEVTIGVESLYFLKYSDLLEKINIDDISIFNTLLSVKTMKGIEYYSKSREKMRTLYTESFAVKDLDSSEPVPDPIYKIIPEEITRYLLQTDKTFGKNLYKAIYRYDGNTIWINIVNKTKMKYSFIPMVKIDNMNVNLFVTTIEDGLLFYGVSIVETSSFLGLAKSKKESFYNRIKAMFMWFSEQLED